MCSECFENEIQSFPSEQYWLKFDLQLTKKLGSRKMRNVPFERVTKNGEDGGDYIYECLSCGQSWKLRDPDYSERGFFLRI